MGEIIPFGKRVKEEKKPEPDKRESLAGLASSGNFSKVLRVGLQMLGVEDVVIDPTLMIELHLNSLQGYVSTNSIATARISLKEANLKDLEEIARKSNSAEWSKRPGYFRALIDEIRSRKS